MIVATPDHMHAVIASAAIASAGTLHPESRCLVGARGAASREEGDRQSEMMRRWATSVTRRTARGVASNKFRAASSARSARCLSGRSAAQFLASGDAGRRPVSRCTQLRWDNRGMMQRLGAAMAAGTGPIRCPTSCSQIFPRLAPQHQVPPALSSIELAQLSRLGSGRARRHGRAPDGFSGVCT